MLLRRVRDEPGTLVPRHAHERTEQVMHVFDGELEMTVGVQTRTPGERDIVVANRGVGHELRSERRCGFFEALSFVTLDHVGDREPDLVLGPDGGRLHVER